MRSAQEDRERLRFKDSNALPTLKLLIDLKSKNPDASPTELLRLFQCSYRALLKAAEQGNEPRVTVPPHVAQASCGIRGPMPTSMLLPLRRVNARIPVS